MQRLYISLLFFISFLLNPATASESQYSAYVGVSQWGILDSEKVTSAVLSYELTQLESDLHIRPNFIVMFGEQNHHYLALGAAKYFNISDKFELGIGFSAGYLNKSKELGSSLEFYSRLIAKYRIQPNQFLRMEFGHISNAGISNTNPGAENIVLAYEYQF